MDFSIVRSLNRFLAAHDAVADPLVLYVQLSQLLFIALVGAALLLGGRHQARRRRAALLAAVSTPLALGVAQVVSQLVQRPRPFVAHEGALTLFTSPAPDPGFPSDHATGSFAIATALVLYDRRWGAGALALAALLAVGRIATGVHYPTDVAAGALLGAVTAWITWRALRGPVARTADHVGVLRARLLRRTTAARG